mgnify:CR=1 FL=1
MLPNLSREISIFNKRLYLYLRVSKISKLKWANIKDAKIAVNRIINMASNKELEKRIETLEREVQHLKAVLQYQMRNKKK